MIAGAIATVKGRTTTAAKTPTLAFFQKVGRPSKFRLRLSEASAFFLNRIEQAAKQDIPCVLRIPAGKQGFEAEPFARRGGDRWIGSALHAHFLREPRRPSKIARVTCR